MKHLKREVVPKSWPVPRKGTTFVVRSNSNPEKGVPMLIFLRDMVKVSQNRKEVKRALVNKNILINGKYVSDEKNAVVLLDVVTIVPSKKYFVLDLTENGKFVAREISEKESMNKVSKITGKKSLRGKKTQINLIDGRNFISNVKCVVGDSVLIDFKGNKIEKCVPLKDKAKVIIFAGKHAGMKGEIEKIDEERKMASVSSNGEKINVLVEQLMVTE